MTDRLEKIFSVIPDCETFADIGCDHGYVAKNMLDRKKCSRVIISDISKACLLKAETLLAEYLKNGTATAVVSDGFTNVTGCDVALISGMGGKEIISIIQNAPSLPQTLVLQPMKSVSELRRFVTGFGYRIAYDRMFKSQGKIYDLIVIKKGYEELTEEQIEFGKGNLAKDNTDFTEYVNKSIQKLNACLNNPDMSEQATKQVAERIERLKKCLL